MCALRVFPLQLEPYRSRLTNSLATLASHAVLLTFLAALLLASGSAQARLFLAFFFFSFHLFFGGGFRSRLCVTYMEFDFFFCFKKAFRLSAWGIGALLTSAHVLVVISLSQLCFESI